QSEKNPMARNSPTPRVAASTHSIAGRLAHSAAVAVLTLAVLMGCGKKPDAPPATGPAAGGPPPAMPVTVVKVTPQRVPNVIEAVGQTEGSKDIEVRARVSGIVEKTLYAEGDRVKTGAVLFQIDRAPFENAMAQAKASVAQARASLDQERAKLEQARREAARLKPLVEKRAISQKEYDDATSTLKGADALIAAAEARIRDAESRVREAELNLSYTNVKAPIGGVTGRAQRSVGSLVTAGTDSALLTTISQPDPIWVRFSVAEGEYSQLRAASKQAEVRLVLQDGSVYPATGRLNFTSSSVDTKLGTIHLRGVFPNPSLALLPGQFVRVRLYAGETEGTLVPQVAVVQNAQGRFVWVVGADGKAVLKPIEGSGWIGRDWLITKGVVPGDQIIVDNLLKLRPGAPVQPNGGEIKTAPAKAN
ncbi:MAG: efflux RND transporter periplasmic adaptor subunit, partial [Casimicrobiaceae bacterium]